MKLEEALGLVEEVRNCSLPWDDAHWEALGIVIDYVKNKSQKQWKPSEEQIAAIEYIIKKYESTTIHFYEGAAKQLYSLLEQLKQL